MTVTAVDTTVSATSIYATAASTTAKQTLDSEVFLNLLVAQLRAQDPSSPMDTNEMIAQTTQLASMEQLTTMSGLATESFALQMRVAASNLVGNTVSWVDDDGVTQSGKATAVSFADKVPMVTVGDQSIRLDAISGITAASTTTV
jgi:flagellar basal-body rod modification protein FlgD